jgi:hypothetical protein
MSEQGSNYPPSSALLTLSQLLVLAVKIILVLALLHTAAPIVHPVVDVAAPIVVFDKVVLGQARADNGAVLFFVDFVVDLRLVRLDISMATWESIAEWGWIGDR